MQECLPASEQAPIKEEDLPSVASFGLDEEVQAEEEETKTKGTQMEETAQVSS